MSFLRAFAKKKELERSSKTVKDSPLAPSSHSGEVFLLYIYFFLSVCTKNKGVS